MARWREAAAAGALLLFVGLLTGPVAAQGTAEPHPGCQETPHTCDPVAANGGVVRSGDAPVRVILFGHMPTGVLNVEPPTPDEPDAWWQSTLMPTVYTYPEWAPCCKFRNNEFGLRFTPAPVERTDEGWKSDHHPLFAYDLPLVGDYMHFLVYVSPGGGPGPMQEAGVVPNLGVYARAYTGPVPSADLTIADGDTGGYGTVPAADSGATLISAPGEDPVYELRVTMPIAYPRLHGVHEEMPQVPDRWGLNIQFVVYQVDGNGFVSAMQSGWQLRSGSEYPPRLLFDTSRVLRFEDRSIERTGGDAYEFEWSVLGAFGSVDVDESSAEILVEGPVTFEPELVNVRKSTDHSGITSPVTLTWRSPEAMDRVPDGTYRITASVLNSQATYRLTWEEGFAVRNGQPVPSDQARLEGSAHTPAASLFFVLLAVAGVAALHPRP